VASILEEGTDRGKENSTDQKVANEDVRREHLETTNQWPDDHHQEKASHDPDITATEIKTQETERFDLSMAARDGCRIVVFRWHCGFIGYQPVESGKLRVVFCPL
jgi:hypothetical protein